MSHTKHASMWRRTLGALVAASGVALVGGALTAAAEDGPPLGAARSFALLGGSTVTNTGPSIVTGDVGVSPGTAITGFPPGTVTGGSIHAGDAAAARAHSDAALAYAFLEGMWSIPANNLSGTDLGGLTLAPGVYKFNTAAQLTGDLTLDAQGDPGALFVLQIGTTLTTSSGSSVIVINGGADYDESNVFWQVGSSATLGSGTAFTGNILAYSSITIVSGSSMTGNALALNGGVTTDSNTNTSPSLATDDPPVDPPADPTAPINLTAVLSGTTAAPSADLRWNDASDYETDFRVFRRDGAGPGFVLIGSTGTTDMLGEGGVATYHDPVLTPSVTYTYRVTAFSIANGDSDPSNEALLDTGDVIPPGVAVVPPLALTAVLTGEAESPGADLTWTDVSDNETEFRVFRRDGAGPNFVQVGSTATADTGGAGGEMTFHDPLLDPSTTFTYRVTALTLAALESAPSNEALLDTATLVTPPARWVDVHLGRRRSFVRDRVRPRADSVFIRGSYSVIDVDTSVPTVLNDADPRIDGIAIQVRAPGNLVLLTIPANDPNWRVSKMGKYVWRSRNGRDAPAARIRINTRKSEFTLRSSRNDFGSNPVNSITVSFTSQGATGSDTRVWNNPAKTRARSTVLFTSPR